MLLAPSLTFAKDLGTVGKTYAFAERDALAEVQERVKHVDWKKQMDGLRASGRKIVKEQLDIPRATADRVKVVDATYTLETDVPDPRNPSRVLYPRGFSLTPLQYMTLPGCVVFVDGDDRSQRDWLKSSGYGADSTAMIILTGGDLPREEKSFQRPLYFADSALIERFGIAAVPSVACQKGESFEVQEIKVRTRY